MSAKITAYICCQLPPGITTEKATWPVPGLSYVPGEKICVCSDQVVCPGELRVPLTENCPDVCSALGYRLYPCTNMPMRTQIQQHKVWAQIWPAEPEPGCRLTAGKIKAKICETVQVDCGYCNIFPSLAWRRKCTIEEWPLGDRITCDSHVSVKYSNSDDCHWVKSEVWLSGPRDELFAYSESISNLGAIPIKKQCTCRDPRCGYSFYIDESESCPFACPKCGAFRTEEGETFFTPKDDVFLGEHYVDLPRMTDFAVPGDLVILYWHFKDATGYSLAAPISAYFETPAVAGGKVKAIIGDYGDTGIYYTVEIKGAEVSCVPSDFAQYEVDDWVYLIKINDTEAQQCICPPPKAFCTGKRSLNYGVMAGPTFEDEFDSNELLILINAERQARGLDPLYMSAELCAAAMIHVRDMVFNRFVEHTGSDDSTPYSRICGTEYCEGTGAIYTGENVAAGQTTIEAVVDGWMDSALHRANILSENFREMGIATDTDENDYRYWCQTFGYNSERDPTGAPIIPEYMIVPFRINGIGPA